MADKKISALTASTTPLAGTEVLPIVQSGSTVKVAVSDLTAGRTAAAANWTVGAAGEFRGTNDASYMVVQASITSGAAAFYLSGSTRPGDAGNISVGCNDLTVYNSIFTAIKFKVATNGDVTLNTGNLVIGASGKGIDFSATPGTGTSELLADYEEGTWTPSIGGTATYTSQTGRYTKIGRLVTFFGDLTINVQGTGNAGSISGLPFTVLGNNAVYVGYFSNLGQSVLSISPFTGGTDVLLYGLLAAAPTATNLTIMTNGARLMFQGSYEV